MVLLRPGICALVSAVSLPICHPRLLLGFLVYTSAWWKRATVLQRLANVVRKCELDLKQWFATVVASTYAVAFCHCGCKRKRIKKKIKKQRVKKPKKRRKDPYGQKRTKKQKLPIKVPQEGHVKSILLEETKKMTKDTKKKNRIQVGALHGKFFGWLWLALWVLPTSASSVSVVVESSPVSFELLSSNESHNYVEYVGNYATGPPGPPGRVESQPWQSNASMRAPDAATQQTSPQHSAESWLWECGESDWCWPWDAPNPLVGPMWLIFCMFVGLMLPSNTQCKTKNRFGSCSRVMSLKFIRFSLP